MGIFAATSRSSLGVRLDSQSRILCSDPKRIPGDGWDDPRSRMGFILEGSLGIKMGPRQLSPVDFGITQKRIVCPDPQELKR